MARTPNYGFERREREKKKAEKKAEREQAKREKSRLRREARDGSPDSDGSETDVEPEC